MQNVVTKCPVLVFAASDSAGLAGIQADNRAITAASSHPLNVITATTAQNNQGVVSINPTSIEVLSDQWRAVNVFAPRVIKAGLVANDEQIEFLLSQLVSHQLLVWDPVQIATSGDTLATGCSNDKLLALLKRCDLVTPNKQEAIFLLSELCNNPLPERKTKPNLANALLSIGCKAVLITGGDDSQETTLSTDRTRCSDFLALRNPFDRKLPDSTFWLSSPNIDSDNTRGTGCSFASLIAAHAAKGNYLEEAVFRSKQMLQCALTNNFSIYAGEFTVEKGSLDFSANHDIAFDELPAIHYSSLASSHRGNAEKMNRTPIKFKSCALPNGQSEPIGLYPVVDRAYWLTRLLPRGVSTIQLRIKDLTGEALENEIASAIAIARQHNARLFINDFVELAIKHGGYGVHLGQEDLYKVDSENGLAVKLTDIADAGLRLGVSNHALYEVAATLTLVKPSYLAFGPIFPTDSKPMPWKNQGVAALKDWVKATDLPIVAIGGINAGNMRSVASTGVEGIALISAITHASDPENESSRLMQLMSSGNLSND